MKKIRLKIVNQIKEQLDFVLQNESTITDFSLIGKEVGVKDMEGYMISGYIEVEGGNADLYYSVNVYEDSFNVGFIPPAFPLTHKLLEQIDSFNSNTKYNAEYLERYLTVYTPYYNLYSNNVDVEVVKLIIETINDPTFVEMIEPHLYFYECPKCGEIVELDYPIDADDYIYHCYSCGGNYSIEEITGITDYIDEYK